MSVCEVCERQTAEPITHPEEGIDYPSRRHRCVAAAPGRRLIVAAIAVGYLAWDAANSDRKDR